MAGLPIHIVDVEEAHPVHGQNSSRDPCGNNIIRGFSRKSNSLSSRTKPRSHQQLSVRKPSNRKVSRLSSPFKPNSLKTRLKHALRSLRVLPVPTGASVTTSRRFNDAFAADTLLILSYAREYARIRYPKKYFLFI